MRPLSGSTEMSLRAFCELPRKASCWWVSFGVNRRGDVIQWNSFIPLLEELDS